MAEDAEATFDEPSLDALTLAVLAREELHNRMGDSQLDRLAHWRPPKGSRESTL